MNARLMSNAATRIGFVPVCAAHLPMLAEWMARPHWRRWWGDPDSELDLIRDMIEGRDSTHPFIFTLDDQPAGYIQVWFIADQRDDPEVLAEYPWLTLLSETTVGVDLSLANESELGKGIGSTAVRLFTQNLWDAGHRTIVIDPDPDNARAVRAYEKAGFRPIPELLGRTGDCLLMQFIPSESNRRS